MSSCRTISPRRLPPASVSPQGLPVASWFSGGSPRSANVFNAGSFQIISSAPGLACIRNRVCLLRAECVFPTAPRLCCLYTLLDFKVRYSRSSYSWSRSSGWKAWCGLGPLSPWGEPLQLWLYSHLWVTFPGGVALDYTIPLHCYLSHCGSLLISVGVGNVFGWCHIVHLDGCSVNSCNFGVRVGGGELKFLPLHSVGHSPLVLRNLKPSVGQGCVPPGSSWEIVLDFQCLDAACIPWFMALFSHHFTVLLPESYLLLSFVTLNKRQ